MIRIYDGRMIILYVVHLTITGPCGDTESCLHVWKGMQHAWGSQGDGAVSGAGLHAARRFCWPCLAGDAKSCNHEGQTLQ